MSDNEKTCKRLGYTLGSALLFLAPSTKTEADPLPVLETVPIEVDIASLPPSEQAALVPILRAARQLDALYVRQVWPGTRVGLTKAATAQMRRLVVRRSGSMPLPIARTTRRGSCE